MKNALVLLAVLAMTSAASAVTIIDLWISSLNGQPINPVKEITIDESDWINFDIVYYPDGAMDLLTLNTIVSVDGAGTLDVSELTWPWAFNFPIEISPGKQYELATGWFDGMGEGILIDHFLLHCDQGLPANDVIISLSPGLSWGGTIHVDAMPYDGQWGSVTVHQVPEPLTAVLLGIGGLALLRKRRT